MSNMDVHQRSLADKVAYFKKMKSFGTSTSIFHENGDADAFDAREERDRRHHARFFSMPVHGSSMQQLQTKESKQNKDDNMDADASPSTAATVSRQVIKATQPGDIKRRGRLSNLLGETSAAGDETVVPDSTHPAVKGPRRLNSSPMPRPAGVTLGDSIDQSPSVKLGLKKRKRDSLPKLRPEEEQIFKNLAFYYIPNNDIAPARRLRINKSREFGATWARDVSVATHVVVDKDITYKDVGKVLAEANGTYAPQVVNEEYPVDCIRFRSLLDHNQKKYQLPGQPMPPPQPSPAAAVEELTEAAPAKKTSERKPAVQPSSSEESAKSLKLKPQHRDSRKWDYVPVLGTPLRSEESSQKSVVVGTPAGVDSQPISLNIHHAETVPTREDGQKARDYGEGKEAPDDALSEYISMMQDFKDLPLDNEDDDEASGGGQFETHSDVDERSGSGSEQEHQNRLAQPTRKRLRSGNKAIAFEDRFACNQAGAQDAFQKNPNSRTIEVLQSMANYYDRVNDHWRTTGYRKAISTLKRQSVKITTEEEAFRLPHIGRRIAQKIEEIVMTNKLQRLEYAEEEPTDESLQLFLQIYGVGNKQAQQWISRGYRSPDDLKAKAKLNANQTIGVEHHADLNTRIPRREVEALGAVVRKTAARIDPHVELIIGGSYRRGSDSSNDIDFIVTKLGTESTGDLRPFLGDLVRQLEAENFMVARLASSRSDHDGSKWHGCCVLPRISGFNDDDQYRPTWRRIDFLLVPETEMGAALIYFTGNDIFNRSIRLLAAKKGMRLNQRGLYRDVMRGRDGTKISEGQLIEGRNERKIFEILGVKWREPHERWC